MVVKKRLTPAWISVAGGAVLVGVARLAAAQGYMSSSTGFTYNNPASAMLGDMFSDRIARRHLEAKIAARNRGAAAPAANPQPAVRAGGTTAFHPGGRRAIVEQVPVEKRPLFMQLLTGCDKLYALVMTKSAIGPGDLDDVATASAFYVAIAHSLYWADQPGRGPEAEGPHLKDLRNKLHDRYIERGLLIGKSDQDKQTTRDGLVVSACLPMIQYREARQASDEPAKQALRRTGADLLAKAGLTPTSLRLNRDGSVNLAGIN